MNKYDSEVLIKITYMCCSLEQTQTDLQGLFYPKCT